jgi:hypothetical protein
VDVLRLELLAATCEERRPAGRRRLRLLVRDLQEEQLRELLEDVAVAPERLDEAVLRAHGGLPMRISLKILDVM